MSVYTPRLNLIDIYKGGGYLLANTMIKRFFVKHVYSILIFCINDTITFFD